MNVVFVPGGPGFSSRREADVLGPVLAELGCNTWFWNDPWHGEHVTATPSWQTYLASLQQCISEHIDSNDPLTIVGHSFAVHPLLVLFERVALRPSRLVLIAPTLDAHDAHRRLVQLAACDFAQSHPERTDRLRVLLSRTRSLFDCEMREALAIAAEDPLLLRHYWQDEDAFDAFAETTARPQAQFSPSVFFDVLAGLSSHGCDYLHSSRPLDIETVILFGGCDPVVECRATSIAAKLLFSRVDEQVVENCGHWVHLERPDAFLELLASMRQRC